MLEPFKTFEPLFHIIRVRRRAQAVKTRNNLRVKQDFFVGMTLFFPHQVWKDDPDLSR